MFTKNIKEEIKILKSQGKIENKDYRIVYFSNNIEIKLIKQFCFTKCGYSSKEEQEVSNLQMRYRNSLAAPKKNGNIA